ncbi:diadenylate cyclase CdaA [Streptococcus sp. DD13]|uniref:diadenylate cyclase CdaA n=1 Tax=Streptococcus sp. DD13 TaxID=1777881 RepID=UPI0007974B97|nr:diadenylate cyclase CdaA [Streptococcus sp. DD13]KXT79010.1 hypothetical protein STRDD13_00266 [Streptococcus sp. DD13]
MNLQNFMNANYWASLVSSPWMALMHLFDILMVIIIIYNFIRFVSGTKIMILIRGVLFFIAGYVIATLLGLQTIAWLMNQVLTYGVIAGVIIFAPELRAALEKLGRTTQIFNSQSVPAEELLIQAFVKSVRYMAPRKIGALVAVEQAQTLQQYISTGIPLDADISGELLINIFIPNTPLHDGAVIIQDNKIAVSCAYLPLSESKSISKEFGTRHRAAIGLSEASDAFVFVVSEETGGISIARNGVFKHGLSIEEFEEELRTLFQTEDTQPSGWIKRIGGLRK